jgi:hypothetical protein
MKLTCCIRRDRNKKPQNKEKDCFVFSQTLSIVATVRFHLMNKGHCSLLGWLQKLCSRNSSSWPPLVFDKLTFHSVHSPYSYFFNRKQFFPSVDLSKKNTGIETCEITSLNLQKVFVLITQFIGRTSRPALRSRADRHGEEKRSFQHFSH